MEARPHDLTIIGDLGVDLVMGPLDQWPRAGTESLMGRSELRAGGTAGNAALAVSYLGGRSRLVSAVGNDDFGRWLEGQLRGLNVALQACPAPTSVTVAFLHSWGERTFFTTHGHLEQLSLEHVRAHLSPAPVAGAIALLSGPFLTPALRAAYPRLIDHLADLGYQVALDTGWPPGGWDAGLCAEVTSWLARCRHVLLNELEVTHLACEADLAAAIVRVERTLMPGATLVVKTGARGAIGVEQGERVVSEAPAADVFDTVGAGDAFNAGYLLARSQGADLRAALAAGCSAAVSIISRFPRRQIGAGDLAQALAAGASGQPEAV